MFTKYSLAGTGSYALIVSLLIYFGRMLDIPLTEAEATQLVQSGLLIYGFIASVVGTLRRKDLEFGMIRK